MGHWKCRVRTICSATAALVFVGCGYDYAALESHRVDAGLTGTGGAGGTGGGKIAGSGGTVAPGGAGGAGLGGKAGSGNAGAGHEGAAGDPSGGVDGAGEAGNDSGGIGGKVPAGTGIGGIGEAGGGIGGKGEAGNGNGGSGGKGETGSGSGGIGGSGEAGSGSGGRGGGGTAGEAPSVLSIDFVGGRWSTAGAAGSVLIGAAPMDPSEVAGVKPAARWNSAAGPVGSLPALTLSSGAVTTASVTWISPPAITGPGEWTKGFVDAPGDVRMMNGYLDPLSSSIPATVVVAGLPEAITASGYDVYVYTTGDIQSASTRTSTYTIGTTSITESEVGPTAATFTGFSQALTGGQGNYVVFKKVTGASFILIAKPGSAAVIRAPVNGLQIVSPSGS
jgi:hypothetical protein